MSTAPIEIRTIETGNGNVIHIFWNDEKKLFVVDVANDLGGNEIVRMTLDEHSLLEHAV